MDEKIKTWPLRFPAKENPYMEMASFDWPIVLQCDVIVSFQGHTKIAPSSMRRRVSSSDETPRRELKIRLAHRSIFDDFRGVSSGVESMSNA